MFFLEETRSRFLNFRVMHHPETVSAKPLIDLVSSSKASSSFTILVGNRLGKLADRVILRSV